MWRDIETVETPSLPEAKAALTAARKPLTDALEKWRAQAAQQTALGNPGPVSEYRAKASPDGKSQVIQVREV